MQSTITSPTPIAFLLVSCFLLDARAETVTVYPSQSAFASHLEPSTSSVGSRSAILRASDERDAPDGAACILFLQFDVTAHAQREVESAELTLTLHSDPSGQGTDTFKTSLDSPLGAWTESSLTWDNMGALARMESYTHAENRPDHELTWDLTSIGSSIPEAQGAHLIEGWASYPSKNRGVALIAQGPSRTESCGTGCTRVISERGSYRTFYRTGNRPRLRIEFKESASGGANGGDQWDPDDNNWLNSPSTLSTTCSARTHGPHTLSSSDPRDTFKFRLTKGHTYKFTATGGFGDTFATLGILAGGPILIRADDDDSGQGSHFSITYTPTEPANSETTADWILEVTPNSQGGSASYTLQYQEINCGGGGGCSNPPAPHSPAPRDGETGVVPDFWTQLDWAPVASSYEVFFGTRSAPPFLETQSTSNTDNWLNLVPHTRYYWQVVSKDGSCSASGPVWSFTTGDELTPPQPPSGGDGSSGAGGSSGGGICGVGFVGPLPLTALGLLAIRRRFEGSSVSARSV